MLEWCRISTINRVREDTDETQNLYVAARSQKRVGWMLARAPYGKQQTHMHSTSRSKHSPAQQIKAIASPAQPRKAEQKFSQAKTSQACEQAVQNTHAAQNPNPSDWLFRFGTTSLITRSIQKDADTVLLDLQFILIEDSARMNGHYKWNANRKNTANRNEIKNSGKDHVSLCKFQ